MEQRLVSMLVYALRPLWNSRKIRAEGQIFPSTTTRAICEGWRFQAVGDLVCLKVILETGALESPETIRAAARAAIEGGADFLKTSTGKISVGATPEAVRVLAEVAREAHEATGNLVGIKVSGGVRTAADASRYMMIVARELGLDALNRHNFRFGASSLLSKLREVALGKAPVHATSASSSY